MATERFPLTADAWTDLGPTPCFVQLDRVYPIRFVIADAPPDGLDAPAHTLATGGETSWCDITLTGRRLYARAASAAYGAVVVVSR